MPQKSVLKTNIATTSFALKQKLEHDKLEEFVQHKLQME